MRPFDKEIAANDSADLPLKGNYIRLDDAAPTCTVEVVAARDDSLIGNRVTMRGGDGFVFPGTFERLSISHGEGTSQEVSGLAGFGELKSSRVGGSLTLTSGSTIPTFADVTLVAATKTSILAANASRKEAHIGNLSANTVSIRIGDTNTGAARGVEVLPGQTFMLDTTAEIFAYSTGTPTLALMEVY